MKIILPPIEEFFSVFGLVFLSNVLAFTSLFSEGSDITFNPLTPLLQLSQHGIFALALFFMALRWQGTLVAMTKAPFFCCLLLLIMVSFTWSDFPDETLRRSVALFETMAFGIYFGSRFNLPEQLRQIATAAAIVVVISCLFSVAVPSSAIETGIHAGDFRGPFIQKNELGRIAVFCGIASYLNNPVERVWKLFRLLAIFLSALLVFLSGSKTALLITALVLLAVGFYKALYLFFRRQPVWAVPVVSISILLIFISSLWIAGNLESIVGLTGRDLSLSGRTTIWSAVVTKIGERPLLGYGYVGFWRDIYGGSAYVIKTFNGAYLPRDSHNGFLELALAFGFSGVALFVLSLLHLIKRSLPLPALSKSSAAYWPLTYVTFLILYNQTEATLIAHNSIFWAVYVALLLSDLTESLEDEDLNKENFSRLNLP